MKYLLFSILLGIMAIVISFVMWYIILHGVQIDTNTLIGRMEFFTIQSFLFLSWLINFLTLTGLSVILHDIYKTEK